MKFLKVFFLVLCMILVVAFIGLVVFVRTFDADKYRTQITKEISRSVGRDVAIGKIQLDISFLQGITLNIHQLALADDAAFSKENFLTIEDVQLGLDLQTLIKTRQISILSIEFVSPKINIIRDAKGQINTQGLSQKDEKTTSEEPSSGIASKFNSQMSTASKALSTLLVKSFRLRDGMVTFIDQSLEEPIAIEAKNLNLSVDNFSLNEPIDFNLEGSVFSSWKNITAKGTLEVDVRNLAVHFRNIKIDSDLSKISLEQLEASIPMVKGVGFQEGFEGQLSMAIDEITLNRSGLTKLFADGALQEGRLSIKSAPFPLEKILVKFKINEKDMVIKEANLPLASGQIKMNGAIVDYMQKQAFDVMMEIDQLDLSQLIPKGNQPVELQGKLSGQMDMGGYGLNADAALNSLTGQGELNVQDGKLVNINVLKVFLSKISMLPRLVEKLEENLPQKYKDKLKEKDTPLKKVTLKITLSGRNLNIDSAQVETNVFMITGQGTLNLDRQLSLSVGLSIPQDLSDSMVQATPELEYLLDDNGEIYIPAKIKGQIPDFSYMPDLEYLGKKIIVQHGKEELQKVLQKVLGKDEKEQPAQEGQSTQETTPQDQEPQPQEEKSSEEKLIDSVLDAIFK
ncbi:MAG: AsmA family protein [Candidatus Omnitrophota bacterium]